MKTYLVTIQPQPQSHLIEANNIEEAKIIASDQYHEENDTYPDNIYAEPYLLDDPQYD